MRVLLAPDKFRGTFTAPQVCEHVARGLRAADPRTSIVALPLADGGEGTLEVLLGALGGTRHTIRVDGPLGEPIEAGYGVTTGDVAILESALLCGLGQVPPGRRDPIRATSAGLGQAIASLLDSGVHEFLVGLGGTATVDGGAGMARALGFRFPSPDRIDDSLAHPGLSGARFAILCDVDIPALGPQGAARMFGPQKGATAEQVPRLEERLEALVSACARWAGVDSAQLGTLPMGGAAGGLGLGCRLFLGGRLLPGAGFVMERLGFQPELARADLLITGEGSFDLQSARGKAACIAVQRASAMNRPAAVVTGRWDGTMPEGLSGPVKVFTGAGGGAGTGLLDGPGLGALAADVLRWAASLEGSRS